MHAVLSPVQWEICCSKCNGFLFCPSVCLSQVGVLLRWLNKSSWFSVCRLLSTYPTLCYKKILRRVLTLELCPKLWTWKISRASRSCCQQEFQLSPRDRAMRCVNWNLANCHATVQKLLIRQVLTKSMLWSWRFSRRQCVMDNVHSTMTRSSRLPLSQVSLTNRRRWVVYITCLPTTCCGEIF